MSVKIDVIHGATGKSLASWHAEAVPRVGETISFDNGYAKAARECRTVLRVDWGVYLASDDVAQLEVVRVVVE
jgi:hypothetical protein